MAYKQVERGECWAGFVEYEYRFQRSTKPVRVSVSSELVKNGIVFSTCTGVGRSVFACHDESHPMSGTSEKLTSLTTILSRNESRILSEWVSEQAATASHRGGGMNESDLRGECAEFLGLVNTALRQAGGSDIESPGWSEVREMLEHLSRSRSLRGYSPSETASFIFSMKRPLFSILRSELETDVEALSQATWAATELLDNLGLYTAEVYQKAREEVIARQQEEMLELSTPVVTLWEGILALPMIGTLDSARTQIVMESLLQKIVETSSGLAIIDITGVPTVDTLTAQYLLKTVTAARLMGAECIISGIRPQIAQTIVHLGVDLGGVMTKASLADALALALEKTGRTIRRVKPGK
jgi:rsbT co-antagonist protein RsbR